MRDVTIIISRRHLANFRLARLVLSPCWGSFEESLSPSGRRYSRPLSVLIFYLTPPLPPGLPLSHQQSDTPRFVNNCKWQTMFMIFTLPWPSSSSWTRSSRSWATCICICFLLFLCQTHTHNHGCHVYVVAMPTSSLTFRTADRCTFASDNNNNNKTGCEEERGFAQIFRTPLTEFASSFPTERSLYANM